MTRTLAGSVWSAQPEWRPVLSIGGLDGPAETPFSGITAIAVHPDGRVVVLDRQVPVIRVFSAVGSYLESWSRRGQGPG